MSQQATTEQISTALKRQLSRPGEAVITNTFPSGYGFECDVLVVKKSFHWSEYEIKTSVADYRRDFAKRIKGYHDLRHRRPEENKHAALAGEGQKRKDGQPVPKPKQFYFVMPDGMVDLDEVPKHCGVILFGNNPKLMTDWTGTFIARRAPVLKGHTKMTPNQLFNLLLKK